MMILGKIKVSTTTLLLVGVVISIVLLLLFWLFFTGNKNGDKIVFDHRFVPFTFSYPSNWIVEKDFSEDRVKTFDIIDIMSPNKEFFVTFISSQKNSLANTRAAAPTNYKDGDFQEIYILDNQGVLLLSERGGVSVEDRFNPVMETESLLGGGKSTIYQKLNGMEMISNLELFESQEPNLKHYLNIQYTLSENATEQTWEEYKPVLIEILQSLQAR